VIEHVPVVAVTVTTPVVASTEQAVDDPAEYESVPEPDPPLAVTVWVFP
jgi:hypothetical protein